MKYTKLEDVLKPYAYNLPNQNEYSNLYSGFGEVLHPMRNALRAYKYATMPRTKCFDIDANDAMIRVVEPTMYWCVFMLSALGVNTSAMPKLRKSQPSPSRLIKAYSQYSPFNPGSCVPYKYAQLVKQTQEPIDYERAYYLYAIKYCSDDVARAKTEVREYVHSYWRYSNFKREATRDKPRYAYILNPNLDEREFDWWRKNSRDMKQMLQYWNKPGHTLFTNKPKERRVCIGIMYSWVSAMFDFLDDLKSGQFVYEGKGK